VVRAVCTEVLPQGKPVLGALLFVANRGKGYGWDGEALQNYKFVLETIQSDGQPDTASAVQFLQGVL
jgi:hypothetical protein